MAVFLLAWLQECKILVLGRSFGVSLICYFCPNTFNGDSMVSKIVVTSLTVHIHPYLCIYIFKIKILNLKME